MNAASVTASLGLGVLVFGAYALGYLARARHVTTAAEARVRRQNARGEKTFKRWCKRHAALVDALVANEDGCPDLPILFGGVLHQATDREILKQQSKNAKGWRELWADEATYAPKKGVTCGVSPRHRIGKYLRPNQPAPYGSSKRGKQERPWANGFNASLLGLFTSPPRESELPKLASLEPEPIDPVAAYTALKSSDIVPLVPEEKK
jgi:hypothetical protein